MPDKYYLNDWENLGDPAETAIKKYENHWSVVQAIKQNISVNRNHYFPNTDVGNNLKETLALKNKNNGTFGNI